jgi:2-dehydro-3-deoxyphosphogluconate aldolase/(4S)-4-hydroxy-2-oxoglutarate aldolase
VTNTLERIAAQRVLPVLRSADAEDAMATARACAKAGMTVVELTRSTPGVDDAVRVLTDEGLVVGVGTVTEVREVHEGAKAGASFIVSFASLPEVVTAAREQGLTAIPGAMTPTEVWRCLQTGAEAVKLFPARLLGPPYLRDLRAVLPELRVIVTGGIGADSEVCDWLAAGALAVGIGSAIGCVRSDGAAEVTQRARAVLALASRSSAGGCRS